MTTLLKRKHVLAATASVNLSAVYQAKVIADGPVTYWPLNETTGTTAFDKIGTKNATITQPVTLGLPGIRGKAMSIGVAGKILPSSFPSLGTAFTLEIWVKLTVQPVANKFVIIHRAIFGDGDFQWHYNPGVINFDYFSTSHQIYNISTTLTLNSWYYLVMTGISGQFIMYINGVAQTPFAPTAIGGSGAGPSGLGCSGEAGTDPWNWNGLLQDIAIYQKVLTPAQISSHYAIR